MNYENLINLRVAKSQIRLTVTNFFMAGLTALQSIDNNFFYKQVVIIIIKYFTTIFFG